MEIVKISDIRGAEYNPRHISAEAFEELKGSVSKLGFILPIIVNKDNSTIVAGHQRVKAAVELGIEEVPCFYVSGIDIESEILYNQMHNGTGFEPEENGKCLKHRESGRFYIGVSADDFVIDEFNALYVSEICRLICRFGDALCAIVCGNDVVYGNNYLRAAKYTCGVANVYYLEEEKRGLFDYYFKKDYGSFCYEHVERNDFVQGLAQLNRHATDGWSVLYRECVFPYLEELNGDRENLRILDFGCGKAACITQLRKKYGYKKAIGIEFYNHNKKGIAKAKADEMIEKFIEMVKEHGKFDIVICDSVLNSVVSQEAEDAVLACLNLFLKKGGAIFVSGRSKETWEAEKKLKRTTKAGLGVAFLDEHGLTGFMREGQWYFQKFHSKEDVDELTERCGIDVFTRYYCGTWGFGGYKTKELSQEEYIKAVDYEFNLKLPGGKRYNRHEEIKELFGLKL